MSMRRTRRTFGAEPRESSPAGDELQDGLARVRDRQAAAACLRAAMLAESAAERDGLRRRALRLLWLGPEDRVRRPAC
jgi:hypothetical protein